jgi:hypothetical protein
VDWAFSGDMFSVESAEAQPAAGPLFFKMSMRLLE